MRAGEAKLREGVRGRGASSTLVPRLATFPPAAPALDFGLVCLLKKLVGFNRKSVWKLLNLVGFLSVSLSVLPFVWVLKKTLDASRQVDVIIVGFNGIFAMPLQLTNYLSICCNTYGFFFRESQALHMFFACVK